MNLCGKSRAVLLIFIILFGSQGCGQSDYAIVRIAELVTSKPFDGRPLRFNGIASGTVNVDGKEFFVWEGQYYESRVGGSWFRNDLVLAFPLVALGPDNVAGREVVSFGALCDSLGPIITVRITGPLEPSGERAGFHLDGGMEADRVSNGLLWEPFARKYSSGPDDAPMFCRWGPGRIEFVLGDIHRRPNAEGLSILIRHNLKLEPSGRLVPSEIR